MGSKLTCLALGAVLTIASLQPALADRASAMAALKAQRGVVDVYDDPKGNVYVAVTKGNMDWGNWAKQACRLVAPHQGRIFAIRVSHVTKVNPGASPEKWPRLGEARCN